MENKLEEGQPLPRVSGVHSFTVLGREQCSRGQPRPGGQAQEDAPGNPYPGRRRVLHPAGLSAPLLARSPHTHIGEQEGGAVAR